jgi:hypothetical protein
MTSNASRYAAISGTAAMRSHSAACLRQFAGVVKILLGTGITIGVGGRHALQTIAAIVSMSKNVVGNVHYRNRKASPVFYR